MGQSIVFELSACLDQQEFVVDEEMGYGALGLNEEQQPFCNPGGHIQHRSQHHALREFVKGFFDSFTGLGAGPERYASRVLHVFEELLRDLPVLL